MRLAFHIFFWTVTPASLYIAKIGATCLYSTLLVASPISVISIAKYLGSLSANHQNDVETSNRVRTDLIHLDQSVDILKEAETGSSLRISQLKEDFTYVYLWDWLVSFHMTSLFVFLHHTVASLQISFIEVSILLWTYIVLCLVLLFLKLSLLSNSTNVLSSDVGKRTSRIANLSHSGSCICLKSIALLVPLPGLTKRSELTYNFKHTDSNELEAQKVPRSRVPPKWKMFEATTHLSYLISCNLLHLFGLAVYSYLSITFSCSSRMTIFGTAILIPDDCQHINNDVVARSTMFCAAYSAQVFLCQAAFLIASLYSRESLHSRKEPYDLN